MNKIKIRSQIVREFLAEFLGTFILIVIGDGSVAQSVLGGSTLGINFLSVNVAWGIAVTMGVYVSAGVSGGHINPAVSLAMAMMGKLKFWKVPIYMIAQYLGAIVGSAVVFGVYLDALNNYEGSDSRTEATAGIWATYPQDFLLTESGLADQVVGTAILLICVMAITDSQNSGAPQGIAPFMVGMSVLGIGTSYGFNCGYAINPARDLGPRIFTAMAGWGNLPFEFRDYDWFWVPIVGPHIGALVGCFLYQLCVGLHHTDDTEENYEVKPDLELSGVRNEGFSEHSDTTLY